jgi:hypothetical protein
MGRAAESYLFLRLGYEALELQRIKVPGDNALRCISKDYPYGLRILNSPRT